MMERPRLSPLILALDTSDLDEARKVAGSLEGLVDVVKVGLQLFSSAGTGALESLRGDGFEVFLDLKLMDIPNTVSSAILALCDLEPFMLTLHAMGGQEMMRAAEAAVRDHCRRGEIRRPMLIGVTVLTSMDLLALRKIGVSDSVEGQVERLAKLAKDSGMDGLVTSPLETLKVRRSVGPDMTLVTPGVRFEGDSRDDQKRVSTPADALRAGADFLVVGRPLYRAVDPRSVASEMLRSIGGGRP